MEINIAYGPQKRAFSVFKALPFVLLGAGFLLRLLYAFEGESINENLWSDMNNYIRISNDIRNGIWKPTHFFQSIGYTLILSVFKVSVSLSVLQAIASCFTLLFMFRMVDESAGRKTALITLLIGVVHYPWILYSNFALPEMFFTMFLSICAYLSWKIVSDQRFRLLNSVLWAISFIAAFWLKGTHALWGPLMLLGLFIKFRKDAIRPVMAICIVVGLGLSAHGVLTYKKINKIQLSSSTSGLNFIEGKCPDKRNIDSEGYSWLSPLYFQLGQHSAKTWNRSFTDSGYFMKQGMKCIAKDPFVLIQSFESIPYLFYGNTMWPFSRKPYSRYTRLYELFFASFVIVGLFVYAVHIYRRRIPLHEVIVFVLPVMALFLCVYIFKSEMRYRVPFDIWLIPLGVMGWQKLLSRENEGYLSLKPEMRQS